MTGTVQPLAAASQPSSAHKPGSRHRLDIDGLRAIAVIPVVLYHARLLQMPGGFVGVDVFFVISGYLITGLILNDIDKRRFSIVDFYERRVRRILPALLVVLASASIAAYALLLPHDAKEYGRSLVATLFFLSNVVFSKQAGYFDAPSELKPLLHTWSLAVEEQFYIVYPLFLFLIARFFRRRFTLALSLAFAVSFALSIWQMYKNPVAAFYLAPARGWELMTGGLLALKVFPAIRSKLTSSLLGFAGLLLIGYSVGTFSAETPFPGYNALFPCIGAALIIYTGSAGRSVVAQALSIRPLVFVGLISYSLYLWHWVLLVFTRYYFVHPLTRIETVVAVAAAFVIAALSWRFIETPVRKRTFGSRSWIFAGAAVASLPLAAFGGLAYATHGFPARYTGQLRLLVDGTDDIWKRRNECLGKMCHVGVTGVQDTFILWGDSHAGAIAPAVEQLALANGLSGLVAYQGACAPLLGLKRYDQNFDCKGFNDSVFEHIQAHHIQNVLLEGRWALYAEGKRYKQEQGGPALLTPSRDTERNYAAYEQLVSSTLQQLQRLHVRVVVLASTPEVGIDVPTALAREMMSGTSFPVAPKYPDFLERQHRAFQVLSAAAVRYSAQLIYPDKLLCDSSTCLVADNHRPIYSDDNHLSVHGAMLLRPLLGSALGLKKH